MSEEKSVFKFEPGQVVCPKYAPNISVFIVAREFDTKVAQIFYHGRIFLGERIELSFTKFAECELEPIEEKKIIPLTKVDFENHKEDVLKILRETVVKAAGSIYEPEPVYFREKLVAKMAEKLAKLFLPQEEKKSLPTEPALGAE